MADLQHCISCGRGIALTETAFVRAGVTVCSHCNLKHQLGLAALEFCAQCRRVIRRNEVAHLRDGRVVCEACDSVVVEGEAPAPQQAAVTVAEEREAEADCAVAIVALDLEAERLKHDEVRRSIEAARQRVAAERAALDATRADVERQAASLENTRQLLAAERAALTSARAELERKAGALEAARREAEAHRRAAETSAATVNKRNDSTKLETAAAELQAVENQLAAQLGQLARYQAQLAQREEALARRWSTHRAASVVAGALAAVIALAVVCYTIGQRVVEPVWQASASLEVKGLAKADPVTRIAWLDAQREFLLSGLVLEETINQLGERGVPLDGRAPELRAQLRTELEIHIDDANRLVLQLTQRRPEKTRNEVYFQLDALGRAYLAEAGKHLGAGEPISATGFAEVATLDRFPVEDRRFTAGVVIFLAALGAVILAGAGVRWWFVRAARPRELPLSVNPLLA